MATLVGTYLKLKREEASLSQAKLAHKLGLKSAQSISNIERGVSPFPANFINPISHALKVDPRSFVEAMLMDCKLKLEQEAGIKT